VWLLDMAKRDVLWESAPEADTYHVVSEAEAVVLVECRARRNGVRIEEYPMY
jgi:hypothetical protein